MLRWKRLKRGLKSQNFLRGDNMYLLGEAGKRFVFFEDTYNDVVYKVYLPDDFNEKEDKSGYYDGEFYFISTDGIHKEPVTIQLDYNGNIVRVHNKLNERG